MFRKLTIAVVVAAAAVAAVAAPTAASAAGGWHSYHGHGHHGHRGFRVGFYAPAYAAAPDCYVVRRVVHTPYGKRFRAVTVCN